MDVFKKKCVNPRADTTWLLCSGIPLQCDMERIQQSEEEDDGENTSSSSQEFEDAGLREEKALSDSEIKVHRRLCNGSSCD